MPTGCKGKRPSRKFGKGGKDFYLPLFSLWFSLLGSIPQAPLFSFVVVNPLFPGHTICAPSRYSISLSRRPPRYAITLIPFRESPTHELRHHRRESVSYHSAVTEWASIDGDKEMGGKTSWVTTLRPDSMYHVSSMAADRLHR